MSILNFITIHPIWFALIIIGIYFFIRFYIKPKYFGEKEELKEEQKEIPKSEDLKSNEKDSVGKRISRGFGVMMDKINNSTIVQNIKKEQEDAKKETSGESSKKQPEDSYQWSPDLSGLSKETKL